MNCEKARDLLLEADLPELRGEGGGELARHLRDCPSCQALARRLLDQTAALATSLERLTPPTAVAHVPAVTRIHPARSLRRWAVAVPLALAAGLAVLVFTRDRAPRTPAAGMTSPVALGPSPLDVQVPAGRSVTVFQTDNPNIVVIWSF